jgi:2-octaprenyl-6-methoxyphenol hydroxylase
VATKTRTVSKAEDEIRADVLISGGGMAGMTLALALGQAGLEVVVVDQAAPLETLEPAFDGRSSAIAYASYRMLEVIGAWEGMAETAQPIEEIRVSDGASLMFLHFDQRDLGEGPLGYMVENRHIRMALDGALRKNPHIRRFAPDCIAGLERDAYGAKAELVSGRKIIARLVVSAEGKNSRLREEAGIRSVNWSYRQSGIVTTVQLEHDHQGIAHERFMPGGPFAILPLTGRRASLVWTEPSDLAKVIMGLDDAAFNAEMIKRFGDFLGRVESTGPRWSYPLRFHHAESYIAERLCLVADAAHGIHPIAGQGLNMGFRDIAALAEVLIEADRRGEDIGSSLALERYQQWRRVDNWTLAAVTDGLTWLFSNDIAPIRLARDIGLGIVQKIPPLKKFFMRHARGTVGKLPRLLEGRMV